MSAPHEIFEALGDPVRLEIIERLASAGTLPTVKVVSGLGMSRQAATKHLLILERAGLVESVTRGRVIERKLRADQLAAAQAWLDQHAAMWSTKLTALANYVEEGADDTPSR